MGTNCEPVGCKKTNRIYGVSRDPNTQEYVIVTEFYEEGNLRQVLSRNYETLTWRIASNMLFNINRSLFNMHNRGYYHKDVHSGNILNTRSGVLGYISVVSDFGASCPASSPSSENKCLYGVLPFVAPELFTDGEYNQAADIYGFGMIMYELISGKAPFCERQYDSGLTMAILQGERPTIPEYAPNKYVDVMRRCWDSNPSNRPTTIELSNEFYKWVKDPENMGFDKQKETQWKAQLACLAQNPQQLTTNVLTSRILNF